MCAVFVFMLNKALSMSMSMSILFTIVHTHVAGLSFSHLISTMFCELPLTYFHRLPERKLLSDSVCGILCCNSFKHALK